MKHQDFLVTRMGIILSERGSLIQEHTASHLCEWREERGMGGREAGVEERERGGEGKERGMGGRKAGVEEREREGGRRQG